MKITSFQLEQHLTKTLAKIYLICGDEPFLIQETFTTLLQKARKQGFSERLRLDVDTDSDLEMAYTQAYTPPLMKQRRFLELHWKNKLTKAGQQFLINYAANPSPYTLLVARINKLDSKTEQTQWFKALEKNSVVLPIWPLQANQLPNWIMQIEKSMELQLTKDAAQLLAHYAEGNLHAVAQEIEKLSLSGHPIIDRQVVASLVVDQGCFNAFDLVDQAVAGQSAQVLRILRYLKNEGAEPMLILGAFMHELRTLVKLAKELAKGANLSTLYSQYRIRISKQNGIREFLKRNNIDSCLNLILLASEIDYLVKGLRRGDIWEALERFSLNVAGINFTRNEITNYI